MSFNLSIEQLLDITLINSHNLGGKCKELAQETCYNKPTPVNVPEMVMLMVPSPSQECGPMTVTLPTVQCEEVTEEK